MVGRELQNLRPNGEDHPGVGRGQEESRRSATSRKLRATMTMGKALLWTGISLATMWSYRVQNWEDIHAFGASSYRNLIHRLPMKMASLWIDGHPVLCSWL